MMRQHAPLAANSVPSRGVRQNHWQIRPQRDTPCACALQVRDIENYIEARHVGNCSFPNL